MKHLKTKLYISVLSLLIAAVMLSASTFAWFTLSTTPEIHGIGTTVVINDNLEIAFVKRLEDDEELALPLTPKVGDSQDHYTWGNLVDFSSEQLKDLFVEVFGEDAELTLRPMAVSEKDETKFVYPVYGKFGRVDTEDNEDKDKILNELEEDSDYGIGRVYRVTVEDDPETEEDEEEIAIYAFYLDFWIRTNIKTMEDDEEVGTALILTDGGEGNERSSGGEVEGEGTTFIIEPEKFTSDPDKYDYVDSEEYDTTMRTLIENLRVAFRDITPEGIEGAEKSEDYSIITLDDEDYRDATYVYEKYKVKFHARDEDEEPEIIYLKQNQAKLIRMYFYLDGTELSNPDEDELDLESNKVPTNEIIANVNLQFALDREMKSMDDEDVP